MVVVANVDELKRLADASQTVRVRQLVPRSDRDAAWHGGRHVSVVVGQISSIRGTIFSLIDRVSCVKDYTVIAKKIVWIDDRDTA
ncbi:hypothetical protein RB195_008212 [Necator americanus]|uniref:Uncharacterized protein n=1 Tax=Necator americanus TaxID=51031 RepID=A0ABR1CNU7_NECAM